MFTSLQSVTQHPPEIWYSQHKTS